MQALAGQCAVECSGSRAEGRRGGLLWAARVAQCCIAALVHGCSAPTRMRARLLSSLKCAWHSEQDFPGQMRAAVSGARRVTSRRAHGRRGTCLYVCTPPDVDSSRRSKARSAGHLSGNLKVPAVACSGLTIEPWSARPSRARRGHGLLRASSRVLACQPSLASGGRARRARLEERIVGHCGLDLA